MLVLEEPWVTLEPEAPPVLWFVLCSPASHARAAKANDEPNATLSTGNKRMVAPDKRERDHAQRH
jgi:hypothetical protein